MVGLLRRCRWGMMMIRDRDPMRDAVLRVRAAALRATLASAAPSAPAAFSPPPPFMGRLVGRAFGVRGSGCQVLANRLGDAISGIFGLLGLLGLIGLHRV